MAISAQSDSDDVMSEINVTPLVDVMLVLVVVFLVTAPLLTNTIRVHLPQTAKTNASDTEQKRSVNLTVASDRKLYIDRKEIHLPDLEPELRSLRASFPQVVVHLNADRDVPYGLVAKTMSAVDRAGITRLSVLTVAEE